MKLPKLLKDLIGQFIIPLPKVKEAVYIRHKSTGLLFSIVKFERRGAKIVPLLQSLNGTFLPYWGYDYPGNYTTEDGLPIRPNLF